MELALLPDDEIGQSFLFRLLTWCTFHLYQPIHGGQTVNFTTQPKHQACLFYTRHSTHNSEILPTMTLSYTVTGRVSRALMHRLLVSSMPLLRYIGAVGGERSTAIQMLKTEVLVWRNTRRRR